MSATSQATQQKIERKMREALAAVHLEIIDESWKHAGHAGAASGGGHFILQVVSDRFAGVSLLDRNRMVFGILKDDARGDPCAGDQGDDAGGVEAPRLFLTLFAGAASPR
ncbi:MAG TPA: BolA/IbaG family iron-sulfur metabolism protein [Candidatus Manganitrophaceae bacterium]|nr:BolA/IbaG family iron-sulfur metabolism protein [Candidatus Manganitrophaceae bacterium]